jgi:iron complex outermembrane receptor protein
MKSAHLMYSLIYSMTCSLPLILLANHSAQAADTLQPVPAPTPAPAPATSPAPEPEAQKVTITGGRGNETDQRRQSTAGKLIFGREELDRNGDTTLGDVLKRLPGVTLGGRPGRGGEIRFRGLGSGFTQILLNGERAPRGFSIESLSPDQVERVEIIRGAVAEFSTQAISGTINIVLREGFQQKETQIRLNDSIENGRHTVNASITHPGKIGELSYSLSGSISDGSTEDQNLTENREFNPQPSLVQQLQTERQNNNRGITFTPRFSYRLSNGDTLVFQPLIVKNRNESTGQVLLTQQIDPVLPYASAITRDKSDTQVIRAFGTYQRRLADSARLNLKYGFGRVHNESQGLRLQFDQAGALINTIQDTNDVRDNSSNIGGKYTAPLENLLGKGHLLAIGLDAEFGDRDQTRVSLDNGVNEFAESGINSISRTRRLAGFIQDEWDITEKWSVNLGLRFESIRTRSELAGKPINNSSNVFSPVLNTVVRLPGETKDQVRASLTKSYRAPTLNDLIALPSLSRLNSATRPDRIGNPNLQPELATGIDLAYEHYLSRSGILSVNLFRRNLKDLIRRAVTLENARFVSTPINAGKANTSGIELEAKFQLAELMENAPGLDFRLNYSRFYSRVKDVPGPNNRLDSQAKQTGNFGLDYRLPKSPLTVGGSLNLTPSFATQISSTESSNTGSKQQLDLYGLWKFSAATQLRVSVSNLLHRDAESANQVLTGNGAQTATSNSRTYATFGVKLEFKI